MSNTNTVAHGQHRLAFGSNAAPDPNSKVGGVSIAADRAYVVPSGDGWLVYTRFHSCRACLHAVDGWTQEKVEVVVRILDGEVVL